MAEQTENLALLDVETHAVHGADFAEIFMQILDFDSFGSHIHPTNLLPDIYYRA
jgi:hypothetical protein